MLVLIPLLFFTFLDELASDEDEINEDDVQYIEGLAKKVCIRVFIEMHDYKHCRSHTCKQRLTVFAFI